MRLSKKEDVITKKFSKEDLIRFAKKQKARKKKENISEKHDLITRRAKR